MEAQTPNSGTIAAAAAPAGGALSILRLSGPDALKIALGFLRPRGKAELPPRRATLCDAVEPGGRAVPGALEKNASAPGTAGPAEHPIDEVLAIYYPGPNSATGEDLVEVSCHGSPYVVKRLLEAALSLGARTAEPGEFTRRAFLSGRMDLSQAEAVAQLIRAKNSGAHRAALFQLQGGLSAELARIREPILDALVRVEANLDHPEEDIPSLSAQELQAALAAPAKLIADLAATFARGRILAEGARVCLVGRPNAGKSSLLNALLGRERAIVSAAPGTTRDTLEEEALISGAAAVLVDTAGLREEGGADEVEQAGMARTRAALSSCDLTVLVLDGGRAQTQDDERVRQEILGAAAHDGRPVVTVLNKSDLAGENPAVACDLRVSATKRTGLDALARLIAERLSADAPEPGRAAVTSLRHQEALLSAQGELALAARAPQERPSDWEDRAAFHLREALRELGSVTGQNAPGEVLAQIFSRFCVGK